MSEEAHESVKPNEQQDLKWKEFKELQDALAERVVQIGGSGLCDCADESLSKAHLRALREHGIASSGANVKCLPMAPHDCNQNVAALVKHNPDEYRWWFGLALGKEDGLWHAHSWGVSKKDGRIIETCKEDVQAYFGLPGPP